MLRKGDSNKILKGVTAVVFAAGLTLMNPLDVNADNVDNNASVSAIDFEWPGLLSACLVGGVVNLMVNFKFLYDFDKYADDEDIEEIIDLVKPKR